MSADPTEAVASYCIPAAGGADALLRCEKRAMIIALVIGIALIAAGGGFALWARNSGDADESRRLTMGLACTLSGFAVMWGHIAAARGRTRRRVRQRLGHWPTRYTTVEVRRHVPGIAKPVSEEPAILILRPQDACVQIEGLANRYLIRGADVMQVLLGGGGEHAMAAVVIAYKASGETIQLTVSPDSVLRQMWWQLSGRITPLFDQICRCLRGIE